MTDTSNDGDKVDVLAPTHSSEVATAEAGPSARCCLAGPRLPGAPPPTGGPAPPAGPTGTSCRLRKGAAHIRQATPRGAQAASLCPQLGPLLALSAAQLTPALSHAHKSHFPPPSPACALLSISFLSRWRPKCNPMGWGLKQQTFTSCSWRLEVQGQGVSSSLSPEASLPGLQAAAFLLCPHGAFPVNPPMS